MLIEVAVRYCQLVVDHAKECTVMVWATDLHSKNWAKGQAVLLNG